jgi:hypothetical protein
VLLLGFLDFFFDLWWEGRVFKILVWSSFFFFFFHVIHIAETLDGLNAYIINDLKKKFDFSDFFFTLPSFRTTPCARDTTCKTGSRSSQTGRRHFQTLP